MAGGGGDGVELVVVCAEFGEDIGRAVVGEAVVNEAIPEDTVFGSAGLP